VRWIINCIFAKNSVIAFDEDKQLYIKMRPDMMKLTLSTIALGCALTVSGQLTTPQLELPDPLLMNDGRTRVTNLKEWQARRLEIGTSHILKAPWNF
jgi:hypothetical protein